jgi:hypothetical protein
MACTGSVDLEKLPGILLTQLAREQSEMYALGSFRRAPRLLEISSGDLPTSPARVTYAGDIRGKVLNSNHRECPAAS